MGRGPTRPGARIQTAERKGLKQKKKYGSEYVQLFDCVGGAHQGARGGLPRAEKGGGKGGCPRSQPGNARGAAAFGSRGTRRSWRNPSAGAERSVASKSTYLLLYSIFFKLLLFSVTLSSIEIY